MAITCGLKGPSALHLDAVTEKYIVFLIMWLLLCPCFFCGVTLQDTCLAVSLLLQAYDHSEIVSNFQFGVQVPGN